MRDVLPLFFTAGFFHFQVIVMKFFVLTLVSVSCCVVLGCSGSTEEETVPPGDPAASETDLGEASGSPEDFLNDSTSGDESASEGSTTTD